MKIVGYHIQDESIVNSDGECCSKNHLDFLFKNDPDIIKVFYNLDWAVARLCWILNITQDQLKSFWKTGKVYVEGYKLFLVPHRYFGMSIGDQNTSFSDIYQYDVDLPFDIDPLDAAKKAKEIGQIVYDTLRMLNLEPTSLSSPVSVFQKDVLNLMDLPTNEHLPPEVSEYAFQSLNGGWQECYKKGHWDAVWDYDMISAYTYFTANLIDHRYGEWFKSDKFYPTLPFGLCKGIPRVDSNFSHIFKKTKVKTKDKDETINITPRGQWPKPVVLFHKNVKSLYDYGIGQFKIESAWYWKPYNNKLIKPLEKLMYNLFEWKQYLSGLPREIVKRLLTGTWGKTLEIFNDGQLGHLFNPVFASFIENGCINEDVRFVKENHADDNLISIAVDGCTFDKDLKLVKSGAMGSWKLNHANTPAIMVSSGVGALRDKQNHGAFSLNYQWFVDEIIKDGTKTAYSMKKKTPITIGNALKNDKINKLGEIEESERAVIIGMELKREFLPEMPRTGHDLLHKKYNSIPMDINITELMLENNGGESWK